MKVSATCGSMQKRSKEREKYMELNKAKCQRNRIKMKALTEYLGAKSNTNWRQECEKRSTVLQLHVLRDF